MRSRHLQIAVNLQNAIKGARWITPGEVDSRTHILHVSSNYDGTKATPLVVDFHRHEARVRGRLLQGRRHVSSCGMSCRRRVRGSTYSSCAAGVQVTLCTKQGGTHEPGIANVGWPTLKKYTLP